MHYSNLAMNLFTQEMNLAKIVRLNIIISAALDGSNEKEKAVSILKQSIYIIDLYNLDFNIHQLQDTIFNLYVEMRNYEKAFDHIQSHTLQDVFAYCYLALMYYDLHDLNQAKKTMLEAKLLHSSLPESLIQNVITFVQSIIDQDKKKKVFENYKSIIKYNSYFTPSQESYFKYMFLKYYIDDEEVNKIL